MTVVTHPVPGTIVRVDLSEGFRVPEIGKRRPPIVLSPAIPGRPRMCTIVPLSRAVPRPPLAHHLLVTFDPPLPSPYDRPQAWVKGDIVLTVAFHRLRLLFSGSNGGQRKYDARVLDAETFARVKQCVRRGLGLQNRFALEGPRAHFQIVAGASGT
ncbi:MAG: type II toxin-antitoxin system PemK/MazF family toxin [Rhodospirillales bacterium]|nr:type II toxin-antitoxin system PemK/MazF family toxin [Rhodospirillales bacterium]